jgi:hypothetical protein
MPREKVEAGLQQADSQAVVRIGIAVPGLRVRDDAVEEDHRQVVRRAPSPPEIEPADPMQAPAQPSPRLAAAKDD